MGLPQSLCADDRWLLIVNELEIAIELTMGSLGVWSAKQEVSKSPAKAIFPHLRDPSRSTEF